MKSKVLKKIVAVCLIALIGSASCPITSFAKAPTIDTEVRKELTIGKTQITEKNYDRHEDTILCSFTAPETGKYRFKVTNNGDNSVDCYFLDEDRAIFDWRKYLDINSSYIFSDYSLKKDEKIYFYVETYSKLLATKIEIKQVKAVPSLNKTALSLKVKQTETLRLKNNTQPVIWLSKNKKIATVSSKGVVKAKKEGTTYIYAIADDKLYKCKVAVYK